MPRVPLLLMLVIGLAVGPGCQSRQTPSPAEDAALGPARAAAERGDLEGAIELYREIAAGGSRFARLELADLLERRGGEGDLEAAAAELRHAAERGLALAALRYARMLEAGRGVAADPAAARRWYQAAAAGGLAEAETALGRLARDGIGMPADPAAARAHFERAAAAGDPAAKLALARTLDPRAPGDRGRAERLVGEAIIDLQRAAADEPDAAVRLAELYLNGELIAPDSAAAARWLRVAAEAGDSTARRRLAELLLEGGPGLEPDPAAAAREFRIASSEGDAAARYQLARLHLDGIEVPRDAAEAARWYEAAAEAGDGRAALELGRLYERGDGLEPDPILALMWYRIALAAGDQRADVRVRTLTPSLDPGEIQRAAILADDWRRRTGAIPPVQVELRQPG